MIRCRERPGGVGVSLAHPSDTAPPRRCRRLRRRRWHVHASCTHPDRRSSATGTSADPRRRPVPDADESASSVGPCLNRSGTWPFDSLFRRRARSTFDLTRCPGPCSDHVLADERVFPRSSPTRSGHASRTCGGRLRCTLGPSALLPAVGRPCHERPSQCPPRRGEVVRLIPPRAASLTPDRPAPSFRPLWRTRVPRCQLLHGAFHVERVSSEHPLRRAPPGSG